MNKSVKRSTRVYSLLASNSIIFIAPFVSSIIEANEWMQSYPLFKLKLLYQVIHIFLYLLI